MNQESYGKVAAFSEEMPKNPQFVRVSGIVLLAHILALFFVAFTLFSNPQEKIVKKILVRTITLTPTQASVTAQDKPQLVQSEAITEPEPLVQKELQNEPIALEEQIETPLPQKEAVIPEPISQPKPKPQKEMPVKKAVTKPVPKPAPKPATKPPPKTKPKPAAKQISKQAPKPKETPKPEVKKTTPKPQAKKPTPKKPVNDAPKPKEEPNTQQNALIADALSKLNRSESMQAKKTNLQGTKNSQASKSLTKIGALQADALQIIACEDYVLGSQERSYYDELIMRLKISLKLPEFGEVKALLTLNRLGKVIKAQVTSSKSSKNRKYIEAMLPTLSFPPFGQNFNSEKDHSFTLTLNSDVSY